MKNEKIYIGECAVDSGQIMIVDPCYLGEWKDAKHYKKACNITLKEGYGELLVAGKGGKGVISGTAYGDGVYPVYAKIDKEGRPLSLTIEFA